MDETTSPDRGQATNDAPDTAARRRWMSVLARSSTAEITRLLDAAPAIPGHARLRGPETGLVMLRGRAGGTGAPFNLGEMTVARCTVRNAEGRIGHGYVAGRDLGLAELTAAVDAAMQDPVRAPALQAAVIAPLAARQAEARAAKARRAAATRVDFFTMATMRT